MSPLYFYRLESIAKEKHQSTLTTEHDENRCVLSEMQSDIIVDMITPDYQRLQLLMVNLQKGFWEIF